MNDSWNEMERDEKLSLGALLLDADVSPKKVELELKFWRLFKQTAHKEYLRGRRDGNEEVVVLIKETAPTYESPVGKVWRVSEHVLKAAAMELAALEEKI